MVYALKCLLWGSETMHCPFYDKIYLAERHTLKYGNGNFLEENAIHFHVCLLHSAEIIVCFFRCTKSKTNIFFVSKKTKVIVGNTKKHFVLYFVFLNVAR